MGLETERGAAVAMLRPTSGVSPAAWFESLDCTGRPIISGAIPPPGGTLTLLDGGVAARLTNTALRPLNLRSLRTSGGCGMLSGMTPDPDYPTGLLPADFVPVVAPVVPPGPYWPVP